MTPTTNDNSPSGNASLFLQNQYQFLTPCQMGHIDSDSDSDVDEETTEPTPNEVKFDGPSR